MSVIGEAILKAYLRVLPGRTQKGRSASVSDYYRWQYGTSAKMFSSFPSFEYRGKRILELGCGLGGRAAWLANNGAGQVVGIDINQAEIREAIRLKDEYCLRSSNLTFCECEENQPLSNLGVFDIVLFLDSMEHVVSPLKAIYLAARYAKEGGYVYFTTIGWYHHNGSHTGIPFATMMFSDETIANVLRWQMRQPDYEPTMWDSDPPVARWEGVYDLRDRPGEYLNKITIRQIKRLMKYAPFRERKLVVRGFGNRRLRWLNPLTHIPLVNEMFHSAVIGMLRK